MVLRMLVAATLIALPGIVQEARAQEAKLPATLAWTAYDVGSSGYNQAVAIGAAMKNKYNVSLRVLPGKNDISRLLPLREDKVQLSLNGIGSLFANEGVLEFASKAWGPQGVRMLAVSAADSLTTLVTARDANITTLIAAVVLFQFGTGPIKGFAITLCIGLLASMFTAVFVCRVIFDFFMSRKKITELSI